MGNLLYGFLKVLGSEERNFPAREVDDDDDDHNNANV